MNRIEKKDIEIYMNCINDNKLNETYKFLLDYMNQLQRDFSREMSDKFKTKQVLNGYLDYTYFYFTNEILQDKKLKLGIILNHQKMCFELWLMGSTKDAQIAYWNKFRNSSWSKEKEMPRWYVLSVELVSSPNFENLEKLTKNIMDETVLIYSKLEPEIIN